MKLVVLESPYAGEIPANVVYARQCLRDCLLRGESPIASHLLFTQENVLRDDIVAERELGIAAGLAWLPKADYSVYYTDRGWSRGMLNALQNFSLKTPNIDLRIRGLFRPPLLPPTISPEIESLLINKMEFSR